MNNGLLTSKENAWQTPKWLFNYLSDGVGGFDLDAAADYKNTLVPGDFMGLQKDGTFRDSLKEDWGNRKKIWLNPPYGKEIGKFVLKTLEEAEKGNVIYMLLPARTDTEWFYDLQKFASIFFIKGRIKFELPDGKTGPAPFPSCIAVASNDFNLLTKWRTLEELGYGRK